MSFLLHQVPRKIFVSRVVSIKAIRYVESSAVTEILECGEPSGFGQSTASISDHSKQQISMHGLTMRPSIFVLPLISHAV